MSVSLSVTHVSANVAAHVTTRLYASRPLSAPAATGCELRNGLAAGFNGILTQLENTVPLAVKWFLILAGIAMVILAFTNFLPRIGRIILVVIAGAIFIGIAGPMAGVIAPDKCH